MTDTITLPRRIRRERTKGWRMPPGAIYVGRGSYWGNPYRVGTRDALARVPAVTNHGQLWEYEGRISAAGTRHDYHHADGHITRCDIRLLTAAEAVDCYRALLMGDGRWPLDGWRHTGDYYPHINRIGELAGHDLACWCPEGRPCHADLLLHLANTEGPR